MSVKIEKIQTLKPTKAVAYILQLADNALILGHRLSEWCSKAPVLEQDMAMANIALDLIGQSRTLYAHAAALVGEDVTEDDLAYLRDVAAFRNILLVEMPNGDFAQTIVKQFFFSAYYLPFLEKMMHDSKDDILRGVAAKAHREVRYHLRWSSEWVIRLGDGTAESRNRMLKAIDSLWAYCGEMWQPTTLDNWAAEEGIGTDLSAIESEWWQTVNTVFEEATLPVPESRFFHKGGKIGQHTEYLGYILAEMQFLQRAYPDAEW